MMMRIFGWAAIAGASIATMTLAVPASADSAKALGTFGAWSGYMYAGKAGKVCYAASVPKHSLNAPAHRGEAYFSVTDRTADSSIGVVSVTEGYPYKKDATAEIDVDGAKFSLYTANDSAWTRDDKAVVRAMLKGRTILVYGVPVKGGQNVDTYSLDGFVKALAAVNQACGQK